MCTEKYSNAMPRGLAASIVISLILFAPLLVPVRLQAQFGQKYSVPRGIAVASAAAVPQQSQIKYKGIWEPVSYPDDIHFFDAFFVTADEGWVAGGANQIAGGIILHTTDGGNHWEIQYGDPQSSDRAVTDLRFLDASHGWAVQRTNGASRLLHTRDGKLWMAAGTINVNLRDYMFTSETKGVALSGNVIEATQDGGRTWRQAFPCTAKVQVNGLWQNVLCQWQRLQFVTPTVAYAIARSQAPSPILFLAKTTDEGASWAMGTQELTGDPGDAFFLDELTGYVRAGSPDTGQMFKTTDGGNTWTGMAAAPGKRIQFADPEVGWAVNYRKVSFTTDGGNHWNSREYPFPAMTWAFSLPRRDRGYVVGEHGMIYRYRIVPSEYVAKGMIPAPLLSGIESPLETQVQQLATQVQQLAKDAGVPPMDFTQDASLAGGATGLSSPGTNPSVPLASPNGTAFASGTTPSSTAAPFNPSAMMASGSFAGSVPGCPAVGLAASNMSTASSARPTTSNVGTIAAPSPASSYGFTQDTASTPPANATVATTEISGQFVQDTSTANTTLTAVSTTVPQFVGQYRNLNLTLTGWQMAAQMPASVLCLKQSFQALKNVKDPQATMAAVTNIQSQVGGLVRMVRMAFQKR